jgi:hypothetical protein
MVNQSMHVDPEFDTFTYGSPGRNTAGLRNLESGDMLVFYCGLEPWDFRGDPGLYICGYFEVKTAGYAKEFNDLTLSNLFSQNYHVKHKKVFQDQRQDLVLVKGGRGSKLLDRAVLISDYGEDRSGRALKVLSVEMQTIFGDFGGKISIQRSPTRWVDELFVEGAVSFVRSLD